MTEGTIYFIERGVKIVAARCQRHFLILGVMIKLHFFLAINKDFATMRGIDMSFVEMVSIFDSL